MKKSFKSIKKFIGLGVFLVALLFIASYVSSIVPHTYAFIAPSLPGGGGGASEPGGGSIPYPTATITANATSLNAGSSTSIKWSSTGAITCRMYGGSISSTSRSSTGLSTGALSDDTTYIVTCSNSTGSSSDSVKVSVFPVVGYFRSTKTKVNYNGSATLSWSISGAKSCTISGGSLGNSLPVSPVGSHGISNIIKKTTYTLKCSTKTTVPPLSSTGRCIGTVSGSTGPYEGQSCSQFKTQSTCLQGWPTHGCSWQSN